LVHKRPKLARCAGPPHTPVMAPSSAAIMTPRPTPQ
jgi:hypothetical protein